MKLPKNFPNIKKAHYTLATPQWLQFFIITIMIIFQLGCLYLLYHSVYVTPAPTWVVFLLICLIAGFFFISTRQQVWYRWVSLVVDEDGCYFRVQHSVLKKLKLSTIDQFIFVGWKNIGNIAIEDVDVGDGRNKSVVILIRVTDEEWENQFTTEAYLPKWAKSIKSKPDHEGFRQFILANQFQNLENVKTEILKFKK
ncbi:MAG: hypothetical protein ABL930_00530 [Pseudobdellovibrio sp.]